MVPPVPAPAIRASTFIEDGREAELGVASIAAMISGPVVSSCARGLFICKNSQKSRDLQVQFIAYIAILIQDNGIGNLTLQLQGNT